MSATWSTNPVAGLDFRCNVARTTPFARNPRSAGQRLMAPICPSVAAVHKRLKRRRTQKSALKLAIRRRICHQSGAQIQVPFRRSDEPDVPVRKRTGSANEVTTSRTSESSAGATATRRCFRSHASQRDCAMSGYPMSTGLSGPSVRPRCCATRCIDVRRVWAWTA
jgi:hypothetical protein